MFFSNIFFHEIKNADHFLHIQNPQEFFEVSNKLGEVLVDDVAVGFSQYDVLVSEIENKDLRKQMLRSATNDAASLMITKIQSKLSLQNDN